jgi:hypothetical protein
MPQDIFVDAATASEPKMLQGSEATEVLRTTVLLVAVPQVEVLQCRESP